MDVRLVDVDARRVDRLLDAEPVLEHVDDDLHDRAAQPRRAGAADDEPRPALAASTIVGAIMLVRRRPRRGRRGRPREVVLAEHVVQVDPGAGTITPEPEPVEADSDAALPSASTTEMCVVPPGGAGSATPASRRSIRAERRARRSPRREQRAGEPAAVQLA